jgi:Flp pilus assembly protein TadD
MACFNLANALRLHGDVQEATTYLQQAVDLKPDSAEAHNQLGLLEAQQGKLQSAIAQFQEALRLRPNDPLAQQSLRRAQAALEAGK